MLTEHEINDVWDAQVSSEIRALYFGDLASYYSTQKQWITGGSFFLASGAMATLVGRLPLWIPILCSLIVALGNAYSVAVNLDSKIRTMSRLHYAWSQLGSNYLRLWNHTYADEAGAELQDLKRKEAEFSELATTDAPYDRKRLSHWQDFVFKLRRLENA